MAQSLVISVRALCDGFTIFMELHNGQGLHKVGVVLMVRDKTQHLFIYLRGSSPQNT